MFCLEIYVGSTTGLASQIDLPLGTPVSCGPTPTERCAGRRSIEKVVARSNHYYIGFLYKKNILGPTTSHISIVDNKNGFSVHMFGIDHRWYMYSSHIREWTYKDQWCLRRPSIPVFRPAAPKRFGETMVCLEIYVGSTTVLASQIDLSPGTPSSRDKILPRDMLVGDPSKKLWLAPIAASEEIFRYITCGVAF